MPPACPAHMQGVPGPRLPPQASGGGLSPPGHWQPGQSHTVRPGEKTGTRRREESQGRVPLSHIRGTRSRTPRYALLPHALALHTQSQCVVKHTFCTKQQTRCIFSCACYHRSRNKCVCRSSGKSAESGPTGPRSRLWPSCSVRG